MINSQEYNFHSEYLPLFVPNIYYYEIRNAALYPFPARHPDTSTILCIWFKHKTDAGNQTYEVSFSLNDSGYRIVNTFYSQLEEQVDAWLSRVREATAL